VVLSWQGEDAVKSIQFTEIQIIVALNLRQEKDPMRELLIALVIGVIAWQAWGAYQGRIADEELLDDSESSVTAQLLDQEAASDERSPYWCDGRTHCSEMTSCEEAEFFLANCPSVKMDGGGDGVPCEKQWCGAR
jgi:hypothetical protein